MGLVWLRERMSTCGDQSAIVWQGVPYSYSQILQRWDKWSEHLDDLGVSAGRVVALNGDYSPAACALLLALIDRRAIVVPLTDAVAAKREEFLEIAEVGVELTLDQGDDWEVSHRTELVANPLLRQLIDEGQPGLVLFSSGSTGKSKAALHDFSALLEKFKVRRHSMTAISFLLLDHIGGINTLLYTLSNGGTVVAVASRDPAVVCRSIEEFKVQLLPTSPTFLNMLLISEAYRDHDLSSLELVTYGTEVMPQSTLKRVHELLPETRLLQTYGLSELGILRSKSKDSKSLWVKVGGEGFETKVKNGTLWIRAQSAMLGYLNAPSPFDSEGWMDTQDVVEVEGEFIRILGRKTEIINVGGQKVYPIEVEDVLTEMDNIQDVTVYGEQNPITGSIVAARVNLVRPESLRDLKKRLRAFCAERLETFKVPVKVEITTEEQFSARYKKRRSTASETVKS